MSDALQTKEAYLEVCADSKKQPDSEIIAILDSIVDDQIL